MVAQHVAEPVDAAHVEVVGRFVEQQNVRIVEEHLGQQDPQLEAAGEGRERLGVELLGDAEPGEQFGGVGLHGVAAGVGEEPFDVVGALLLLGGEIRLAVEVLPLAVDTPEFFVAHADHVENWNLLIVVVVLFKEADPALLVDRDGAGGRLLLAGEDLHECGLA